MTKAKALCLCALVLIVICCVQQVRSLHLLRDYLSPHTNDLQVSNRQTQGESETFNRYRRFNRLHTCSTDMDCVGRNRPSCCVALRQSSLRVCQPLSKLGHVCNTFSRPHMWNGERLGMHCPCESGLECLADSTSSFVSRGTCV